MDVKDAVYEELDCVDVLETVEMLITDASAATDEGNYSGALQGFKCALELIQRSFGRNSELENIGDNIDDIYDLLESTTSSVS